MAKAIRRTANLLKAWAAGAEIREMGSFAPVKYRPNGAGSPFDPCPWRILDEGAEEPYYIPTPARFLMAVWPDGSWTDSADVVIREAVRRPYTAVCEWIPEWWAESADFIRTTDEPAVLHVWAESDVEVLKAAECEIVERFGFEALEYSNCVAILRGHVPPVSF